MNSAISVSSADSGAERDTHPLHTVRTSLRTAAARMFGATGFDK